MKNFIAALLAGLTLFTLVGCSGGSKADSSTPKDYAQIIHDARSDEDNEYDMIFYQGARTASLPPLTVTAPSTSPTS